MGMLQRQAIRTLRRAAPLNAEQLIDAALGALGREGFSDWSFREALERLLDTLQTEAHLGLFGQLATRFDVLRCLHNLLRLDIAEQADPGIALRPLGRPIFITGLPRSG